ncbi:MAG: antibiotic biosynthesis monooxygenase family protein [Anaerolineales bacterium]
MTSMLVRSKVEDFQTWKKGFDEGADLRTSFGGGAEQVFQDASDPNTYVAVIEWDTLEDARKFAQSPELKAAMAKAGVVGTPTVYFMNRT